MSEQRFDDYNAENEPLLINANTVMGAKTILYRMENNGKVPDTPTEKRALIGAANRELDRYGVAERATSETLDHVLSVLSAESE